MEIRDIYKSQIMAMFKENVVKDGETLSAFCEALQTGNAPEAERLFSGYLGKTISIRDTFVRKPTKENFYHGILRGILGFKNGWYVKSNKESGDGYSDIIVKPDDEDIGIIIEVKYAERGRLESECQGALEQIETDGYTEKLKEEGCSLIYKYGVACYKKRCRIMVETESCMQEEL
uniref:PD-(D/E)XK nuclease superfamily protein n=1 Tax=uncultured bacterium scaffold00090 TaxID=1132476 RepID=I6ZMB2_9BACT|nr:hypothetical protein [uncultured bacterium scaffold00090]